MFYLWIHNDFKKFASNMREVLNYIKYLKDEKRFAKFFEEDERLKILEAGAVRVIAETEKS